MKALEEKIIKDGHVAKGDILKVDSFLNHQIDVKFMNEIGKEFKRLYADKQVDKILTIEASGIGIACITAQYFDVPVVFAKKTKTKNIYGNFYTSAVKSFTHGTTYDIILSKEFLLNNSFIFSTSSSVLSLILELIPYLIILSSEEELNA